MKRPILKFELFGGKLLAKDPLSDNKDEDDLFSWGMTVLYACAVIILASNLMLTKYRHTI